MQRLKRVSPFGCIACLATLACIIFVLYGEVHPRDLKSDVDAIGFSAHRNNSLNVEFLDMLIQRGPKTSGGIYSLAIFRPSVETTKEKRSRERFGAHYVHNMKESVLHIMNSRPWVADGLGFLNALQVVVSSILPVAEWVLFLEDGAILADPLKLPCFGDDLLRYAENSMHIISFGQQGLKPSSLLIHQSKAAILLAFIAAVTTEEQRTNAVSAVVVWREFVKLLKPYFINSRVLFTHESDWIGVFDPANLRQLTVYDRISPDTWKLIADFHYGQMPATALLNQSFDIGSLRKISFDEKVKESVTEDGSVIFVDSWALEEFIKEIAPRIQITQAKLLEINLT
ncbi:hypothetical protein HDU84_007772 [Entophlyctis sp. JEL0112]|nr:hypothetical protein HDU84_007772 [Entophlyctis sp. JEL0112]